MVYVDVSNYGVPRVQNFPMVGGARIVVFVSVCGLVLYVFSTGLWLDVCVCCPSIS